MALEFARAIEKRCLDLGAEIHYGTRVEKIRVEDGKAVGLRLAGGEEVRADYAICAADLRAALYELLDGRHVDPQHEELLKGVKLFPSSVQVSFGVDLDLAGRADAVGEGWKLEQPIRAGGQEHGWFFMRNFAFDPTLAPAGKTVVECTFQAADFDWWERLGADRAAYRAEKERFAEAAAAELERRFPGFRSRLEVTDVATPPTYARYTGNWKGTYMTWVLTPEVSRRFRLVKKTVPGLDNFWLSGMWVMPPGGVPVGAKTSRDIIQLICRRDGKRFTAPKPCAATAN